MTTSPSPKVIANPTALPRGLWCYGVCQCDQTRAESFYVSRFGHAPAQVYRIEGRDEFWMPVEGEHNA